VIQTIHHDLQALEYVSIKKHSILVLLSHKSSVSKMNGFSIIEQITPF